MVGGGIAKVFAEAGAAVFLGFRNGKDRAEALRASLPRAETHRCFPVDGANQESVSACMSEIARAVSRGGVAFSTLVNNAGIYPVAPLAKLDTESWQ